MKAPSVKPVRCAIYTRVSTEHGLDQEFNSLDAQYDAASAYIKRQAHTGWTLVRSRYDDGGYSGGSTDGPTCRDCWTIAAQRCASLAATGITCGGAPRYYQSMNEGGARLALAASRYWICKLQEYFFAHDIPRAVDAVMKARELVWSTRRCFMLWSKPHEVFGIDAR